MKIKDLTIDRVEKEIEELQSKPMTWDTVQWLAALMTIRHRLERVEEEHEHVYHTLTEHDAKEWVSSLVNSDGTYGEHWSCAQTTNLMHSHGMQFNAWEFYAVINSIYSVFGKVLAEFGIPDSNTACYAKLAKAWLHDADAMPHKAMRYYDNVVE